MWIGGWLSWMDGWMRECIGSCMREWVGFGWVGG